MLPGGLTQRCGEKPCIQFDNGLRSVHSLTEYNTCFLEFQNNQFENFGRGTAFSDGALLHLLLWMKNMNTLGFSQKLKSTGIASPVNIWCASFRVSISCSRRSLRSAAGLVPTVQSRFNFSVYS